ncbi:TDP-N-acetylfucosamine:lipid II N-acetylfucosaminyltransferase [Myroides sp. N17-2]|uniref:TDP-N-acetylfucosamine:lipid II N-acetylfucosaminyltransferase n=1 Tax=Myroides sp. N17-2 TaxID=2030799 RepID=UPI000EFA51BD|nr:TDP-N-acetylfucosamine:lipid II N-acetylfucosaminyltransferase [Myroides sp. N17-2]
MNVLHVIDDEKFINSCKATFAVDGIDNYYLNKNKVSDVYIIDNSIHIVVFHYLSLEDAYFISKCTLNIKYIWFFWGADGFCFGEYYNKFLLSKTKRIRILNEFTTSVFSGIKCFTKTLFPFIIDKSKTIHIMSSAIKKIDVVVPVMPLDFEMLKSDYGFENRLIHVNYLTPFFFDNEEEEMPRFSNGRSILLGNSASYTNNHIEAIDVLKACNSTREIIIPLNYGDKSYASRVSNYAKSRLGEKVRVLSDFLDFKEYIAVMDSTSIIVMNHCRQQAVGNIIMGLLTGKTLYLRKETTVFNFLFSEGFYIKEFGENMEELEVFDSIKLLENYHNAYRVFGRERIHKKIEYLLKEVVSE